jgi:hypothetical protein
MHACRKSGSLLLFCWLVVGWVGTWCSAPSWQYCGLLSGVVAPVQAHVQHPSWYDTVRMRTCVHLWPLVVDCIWVGFAVGGDTQRVLVHKATVLVASLYALRTVEQVCVQMGCVYLVILHDQLAARPRPVGCRMQQMTSRSFMCM